MPFNLLFQIWIRGRTSRIYSFVKKKPLIFNSFVYGSFYTAAEFLQQTYNTRIKILEEMKQSEKLHTKTSSDSLSVMESSSGVNYQSINKKESSQWIKNANSMIENYNWPVIQRYIAYGYFMAGPILHGWYVWLDKTYQGTAAKVIIKKLLCDQFILTPPLIILFFISMSWMEGKDDLLQECKVKFVKTFQTSCLYWIPVQFINFLVISPPFRVLYVSIASFCWVNILCHLKRTPISSTEAHDFKTQK
ncbi:hypothetical protein PV327_001923 [Microctonus hyperodae]|uniref:Mpv17-like protein n=1 Tax=Microctonus hyperodae TaxID=165561 RepID=A0AA39KNQ5_MICHY|nr:hypothetical protein PV327_001923 [Microctonus hyperodae]